MRLRLLLHKFQEHTWPTTHDRRIWRNTAINVGYIVYHRWHSRIRYTCNSYFARSSNSFFEYRLCVKKLKYIELYLKHYRYYNGGSSSSCCATSYNSDDGTSRRGSTGWHAQATLETCKYLVVLRCSFTYKSSLTLQLLNLLLKLKNY